MEHKEIEVRKAGARALFNGSPGMWPNFVAEIVRLVGEAVVHSIAPA